jgi:hypothetical protein
VDNRVWWHGPYPSPAARAEVVNGYTWMIRAADDPEPESRESARSRRLADEPGLEPASAIMRSRKRLDVAAAVESVIALLADGHSRTMNRIGIELWQQTADVVDERVWHGVVEAVEAGVLEHSCEAPILVRIYDEPEPTSAADPQQLSLFSAAGAA